MSRAQASPFPHGETHSPLRNHVERGEPYPTLTRRAQFLIEHPWFVEAGEELPVHKDPPPMGGPRSFRLSSGHNRWSVHAMNMANPVLVQTHRGKPSLVINDRDAAARAIADDSPVRVWNDHGEVVVDARVSGAQRPGALTIYNGFESFMFSGGAGANELETGLVKWLGFAGGYGHLGYAPTEWQPIPADRCVYVDIEPAARPVP
jgi:nitrate reductase alpha subunit